MSGLHGEEQTNHDWFHAQEYIDNTNCSQWPLRNKRGDMKLGRGREVRGGLGGFGGKSDQIHCIKF